MEGGEVLDLGRDALWATVIMCAPAMLAGLVVGLVIAFFQALTQIQEMTLVFVPKILVIFAALLIFLPLMGATLAGFSNQIFERIAAFQGALRPHGMDQLTQYVWIGALLFTRLGAVLMLAPGWGEQSVPPTMRLSVALLATAALAPTLAASAPPPPGNMFGAAPLIVSEMIVGLILGGGARLLMSALQVGGAVTGLASGLGFAQQIDPSMGQQSAIFSAFFSMTGLLLIMATGLHRMMLEAAAASYAVFPAGQFPIMGDAVEHVVGAVSEAFKLGVQISAPVLLFSFVFNLALGLATRLVPQVQMYMVAQPAAVLGSVAVLALGFGGGLMIWLDAMERHISYFTPQSGDPLAEESTDKSQKTEEPTQKRLDDARKKGDLAKSQDVPIWFLFMGAAAVLAGAEPLARSIAGPLTSMLDHPHAFRLSGGGAERLARDVVLTIGGPLLVVLGVFFVAALGGHLAQHRPLWTTEKMKPDISKLDPLKGIGRMFGAQGWMNLLKSILKIAAVSAAIAYAIWPDRDLMAKAGELEPAALLVALQEAAGRLMIAALVVVGVVAAIDYLWQRYSFMNRMKMSKQEIKDEFKQSEGDPHIKAKLRQIRMERSRKRMLAAVPTSTVIVTNPTHYSVALRYDPEKDAAPVCVAKGVDELALRIREVAKGADVPIIENVPLARALYATVEVDETVPREHFEAVAKVISFVLGTAKGRRK